MDIVFVDPCCTEAHFNFGRIQVFGLCLLQSGHILPVICKTFFGEAGSRIALCDTQLFPDISGQVFVCRLPLLFHRVMEDHARQFTNKGFLVFAGKLRHIRQIYAGFFRDGERQRLRSGVHGCHDLMGLDRALGEHICLALQIVVLVENF